MEDPPLQPAMTTQQSIFHKREANEPLAVLENSTSETDHCKRLCQEVKVKEEQYLDDDITEVTVPITDPEDRILNGDTGDDGINDSAPITFSDLFQTHPELPVCWTEEQANYFRTQNPWLQIKNGRLGCGICIQVGSLSLHHQVRGSRLAREWLEFLISSTSETRKGQQTALRKKIWEHRESHAHQQAEKVLQKVQSGQLDGPVLNRTEEQETTCRIFRTAYMISKQNRPFSDMPDLVDLQVANGIDMGRVLHTRKSCAEICDFIGNEMKKKLTLFMAEKDVKFSILLEECTTVSNQSALAVCIRAPFGLKSEPLTIFFQLLELQEVTAEAVATELQVCLHEQFPQDYIARNWISFTADGASATLGWASGVATLLNTNDCYPNLVIWHCCNHKLELAVGEALQEVMGADHFKAFIDILYSLYQSSPKNQRELNICAEELAVLFKSTSRVIDTRSIASSCRAVSAIWNVYPALCAHFTSAAADPKRATAEKARYKALLERLTSVVFVKNLGIMRDALVKLYELSLRLQVNTITLPEAHILICLQIQDFQMAAGGKEGDFSKVAAEAAGNLQFQDVALHTGRKADMEIKRESFFQSLTNSLQSRLITSSSRLPSSEGDGFYSDSEELFPACKIVYPQYWPAAFDVQYGEEEVCALCRRFQLPVQQSLQGFREYKDNGGKEVPELLLPLLMTLKTITISTAECERVFSDINNTITSYRNALHINRVSNLLFLQRNGPPFGEFRPESYVVTWLIQGHRSADYVACRERENKEEECNDDKKGLWSLF